MSKFILFFCRNKNWNSSRLPILPLMKQLNYTFNEVKTAPKRNSKQGNSTKQKNNLSFNLSCSFTAEPYVLIPVSAASHHLLPVFPHFRISSNERVRQLTIFSQGNRLDYYFVQLPWEEWKRGIQSCNSFSDVFSVVARKESTLEHAKYDPGWGDYACWNWRLQEIILISKSKEFPSSSSEGF